VRWRWGEGGEGETRGGKRRRGMLGEKRGDGRRNVEHEGGGGVGGGREWVRRRREGKQEGGGGGGERK